MNLRQCGNAASARYKTLNIIYVNVNMFNNRKEKRGMVERLKSGPVQLKLWHQEKGAHKAERKRIIMIKAYVQSL